MTATIDGIVVTGTPEEIVKLIQELREPKITISTGGIITTPFYKSVPNSNIVLC